MKTNRLDAFREAFPRRTQPLLMTALVVGDPFLGATEDYLYAVVEGGADVVELVMPFSDPAFHGPAMRRACARAMKEAVRWEDLFELVSRFREEEDQVPMVVSSYYNRILACGEEQCADRMAEAGVDGVMVMDLPFEEAQGFREILEERGLSLIQHLAASTGEERFRKLVRQARGMLVWTGHTGMEVSLTGEEFHRRMKEMRKYTLVPLVASMDVGSSEEASEVVRSAHGVLVGSSLAWLIEGKGPGVEERLRAFVAELRVSLDAGTLV